MSDFIDILRAEKLAQDRMHEDRDGWNKNFILFFEGRPISCVWLDPYMGIFQLYGKEDQGFMRTSDLPADVKVVYP